MSSLSASLFVRDRFTWLAYFMLAYFAYLQAALGPLMPFLRAELNLNYTVAGLHVSAFAVGMILAGLWGDRLAQLWGRHLVFWGGGVGMALGALGLALTRQVILTISSMLVMGLLGSLLLVMIQATLSDRHGEQRAVALTESNIAASISAALAPVFIGSFQRLGVGWRGALFLAMATLAILALQFHQAKIPETGQDPTRTNSTRQSLLPLAFWAYWLVIILFVSTEWCLIFWGADFLETIVGFSRVNAATLMTVFFGAMILGRITGSRLIRKIPSPTVLLMMALTALIGFPIFWLASFPPLNVAGLFIAGLGVANLFPLAMSVAVGIAARQADAASARISLGIGLAILLAPLFLGWLADQVDIKNAYGIVPVLLLIAIVVTFLTNRLTVSQNQGTS